MIRGPARVEQELIPPSRRPGDRYMKRYRVVGGEACAVVTRGRLFVLTPPAPIRGHQQPLVLHTFEGGPFAVGVLDL